MKNQYKFKDKAGYVITKEPTLADEVKDLIRNAVVTGTQGQPTSTQHYTATKKVSGGTGKKSDSPKYKYSSEIKGIIEQSILQKASTVKWEDLIGLEDVKKKMMETIILPIKNPQLFTGLLSPSKGILLFGPPGNGKTMVAKAIASQFGEEITFFNMSAGTLTSRYYGDSEKLVQTLFAIAAERQPSAVFIDELDSILGARSTEEHEASRRLKTEFLVQFDGVGTRQEDRIVVIGATNRPFDLDEAVLRRFSARIFLPLPNIEARKEMIKNKLKTTNTDMMEDDYISIAKKTEGYSFADLTALCQEAAMEPIRSLDYAKLGTLKKEEVPKLAAKHFDVAIAKVPKSVSEKSIKEYEKWSNDNKK